jgi:hypothetical protein
LPNSTSQKASPAWANASDTTFDAWPGTATLTFEHFDSLGGWQPGTGGYPSGTTYGGGGMAKDHGSSVKNDKQYEGLRKKGMSKSRAAAIANTPDASKKGGKNSGKKKKSS